MADDETIGNPTDGGGAGDFSNASGDTWSMGPDGTETVNMAPETVTPLDLQPIDPNVDTIGPATSGSDSWPSDGDASAPNQEELDSLNQELGRTNPEELDPYSEVGNPFDNRDIEDIAY
jgi:hypothetical protein